MNFKKALDSQYAKRSEMNDFSEYNGMTNSKSQSQFKSQIVRKLTHRSHGRLNNQYGYNNQVEYRQVLDGTIPTTNEGENPLLE